MLTTVKTYLGAYLNKSFIILLGMHVTLVKYAWFGYNIMVKVIMDINDVTSNSNSTINISYVLRQSVQKLKMVAKQ